MIEIVTDFQQRGQFDDPRKLSKILPYKGDLYRSYYTYDDDINLWISEGKDYTTYDKGFTIDTLIIDIDGHTTDKSMELARDKVKNATSWLLGKGVEPDNFLVWFSGGGFHIHIAASLFDFTPGNTLPDSVRDTLLSLFPAGDNIYYPKAIVRVGYSYNTKRKLWKVPLTMHELDLPIKDIKEIASSGEIRDGIHYDTECFEPTLASFRVDASEKFDKNNLVDLPEQEDFVNVVTCMHKLYDRGPLKGRRHTDMLRLASWMRRAHMPAPVAVDSLMTWGSNMKQKEVERIVRDVYNKDYRYGCNDEVRMEFCDKRCIYYEKKNEGSEIMTQGDMDDEMVHFAMQGGYENYLDIVDIIGQEYRMYPGEFIAITGPTGVNKSTFVQQIAIGAESHKVLYVSTEVDRRLMYRRYLQMITHMSKEELMQIFKNGNVVPGSEKLNHIQIVDNVPTWSRLVDMAIETKPSVLILDVMEDVGDEGAMDNIEANAANCKSLAMQLGIIIIAVNHMRKSQGSFRRKTKSLDDMKGSSAVQQKADKVILIEGDNTKLNRKIYSGKARDEEPFEIEVNFNPETFSLE